MSVTDAVTDAPTTTTVASRPEDAASRGSVVSRAARTLVGAMVRRLDIDSLVVQEASTGRIDVGRVELGDASVGRVQLSGIRSVVDTGRVTLRQVRVVVSMVVDVTWRIDLRLFDRNGSFRFGTIELPFTVGDVGIPDLDNIDLGVSEATAISGSVTVRPIVDLTFNGASIDDVSLGEIRLPSDGFALGGLAFDTVALSHLGAPDASVSRLHLGELEPAEPLVIPEVRVTDIELPRVDVPSVTSNRAVTIEGIGLVPPLPPVNLINLGILKVSLDIEPTLQMNIGNLMLEDVEAETSIDAVRIEDIRSPLRVMDVDVQDLELRGLRVEGISV